MTTARVGRKSKEFCALPQDEKEKAKQVRFLQSRGFSLEAIFKVLRLDD
jgi:regulatory protein